MTADQVVGGVRAETNDAGKEVDGLQQALAGIHAAIWGYGVLTPYLDGDARARGQRSYDLYRTLREQFNSMLRARRVTPVAADAGYALPFQVTGNTSASRLAVHLESGCAGVFADLVAAATSAETRMLGANLLRDCAERRLDWDAAPLAFPGVSEKHPGATPTATDRPAPATPSDGSR